MFKKLTANLPLPTTIVTLFITSLNSYELNFKVDPRLRIALGYSEIFPKAIGDTLFLYVSVKEAIIFANDGNKPICVTSVNEDSVELNSEQIEKLDNITDINKASFYIESITKYKSINSGSTKRISSSTDLQFDFLPFDPLVIKPSDIRIENSLDNALITQDSLKFDFGTSFVRRTTVTFLDGNGHQVQKTIIGSIYQITSPQQNGSGSYGIIIKPLRGLQDILR